MPKVLPVPSRLPTYLFVIPWSLSHVGGVNQVVIGLAREMQKAGIYEPIVLIADWQAVHPVWGKAFGLRTVRWRIRSCSPEAGFRQRLIFNVWQWHFDYAFRRFCNEHWVVAVNSHYPGAGVFALQHALSRMSEKLPLMLSFHGTDLAELSGEGHEMIAHWQVLVGCARWVIVCSKSFGRQVTQVFGNAALLQVVHNGIQAEGFVSVGKDSAPLPLSGKTILNVGRFDENKGQGALIRAFALLVDEYTDLQLVLVGASAGALSELKALCRTLRVDHRVAFHTDVPHAQIGQFFQKATVFALPSRAETFGIVILEAGAFGVPVVASRVGGIPEIVEDGVTGRLVPPDDPQALAQALRDLLDAPAEAKALGQRLHQRVLSEFTWEAAYRKYAALLEAPTHAAKIGD